ncbi:diphosphate--fructose-6-phosphate 1-phosphotransferase [Helcococcus ovis]|uniref:diphosphate--fructose-6-phosphate 1-phosphotransferase n=1 Tax=Helcococcus ovis TaxID=72026 RepID=UPI0038B7A85E
MKEKICIIGQSGGPTAVINASLYYLVKEAKNAGFNKIYGMFYGIEGLLQEKIIRLDFLLDCGKLDKIVNRPSSFLGSCRFKLNSFKDKSNLICILEKLYITDMFYIGGNDSMDTILQLSLCAREFGSKINFIGIPKTIDNDLIGTYYCPGYLSACKYILTSLEEIYLDSNVYDDKSVTIVELMGRDTGWLAASASLLNTAEQKKVDLIYLPEIAFDLKYFIANIKKLLKNKKHLLVVVSEGIKDEFGNLYSLPQNECEDSFGHNTNTGCGNVLRKYIQKELSIKAKSIELGILQRCAGHIQSEVDIINTQKFAHKAIELSLDNESGVFVGSYIDDNSQLKLNKVDISLVANKTKKVPTDWIDSKNGQISEDYIKYINKIFTYKRLYD